jgi:hypothetical protein
MGQNICSNPDCQKQYLASETDDGFCSFECWEKINCREPIKVVCEDIPIIE